MSKMDPVLQERLSMVVSALGYDLFGYEWLPQGRHSIFRLYIDSIGGITIDDCVLVSQQVSAMLDAEDLIKQQYTLEVSSPGINRPLLERSHYERYCGKRIKIRLRLPIEKSRQFQGLLQRVDGENIHLFLEESLKEIILPFSSIEKANLVEDIQVNVRRR